VKDEGWPLGIGFQEQVNTDETSEGRDWTRKTPLRGSLLQASSQYTASALSAMHRYVNQTLLRWAMRKFKRFKAHKVRASHFLQRLVRDDASIFVHWRLGMVGTFA
jgi:hypothetical protein